ncbi:MAG: hypothetical protein OHK93_003087 [Ramalina farinacea]|uniref:Uncharacterized protein n=1 Tax=Ramalina farinacea TaxID=258253 RepID=A0AA43QV84_9LECA|nr:hypothetical protein [Ramalina farinacea]
MAECTANAPNIEVNIDGLLNQIHSINGAVAIACLSEDGYFSQDEDVDPAMSKTAERRLTERLENVAMAFEIILGGVKNWADRARNFEQNTVVKASELSWIVPTNALRANTTHYYLLELLIFDQSEQTPAAKRKPLTSANIDVEEEAVHYVTKLLQEGGAIDNKYLQVFDHFINETSRPLRPMFDLIALIESIADTANGRPCSIAAERASKANPQASPERSEHAESDKEDESDKEYDSPSYCPEHNSHSDQEMPDAATNPPPTETVSSPSLLPTPPLTSKTTTFPQSEPPQPQTSTTLDPSSPHPSPTESSPTPYYIARLTSRGYTPSTLSTLSTTDGPIWTRILAAARVALFAANHLASQTESARDQAHRQRPVWKRITNYFDERAGLIRRFRAEGGLHERATVPLSAEEREEHEAAEAVRKVEAMIKRESGGGGDADAEADDEAEEEGEMRARYRRGMQRFEREERWRRSPSIKWTDREEDISGRRLGSGDENRGRAPSRRMDDQDKAQDRRMPGHRSPAPLGFGLRANIDTNTDFSRLGLRSAFDRDVDVLGGGDGEPNPFLTARSPWEVKGKDRGSAG